METNVWSVENHEFYDPGAGILVLGHGDIINVVEMHYFFKKHLLYSLA